jgi:hypothetical protein
MARRGHSRRALFAVELRQAGLLMASPIIDKNNSNNRKTKKTGQKKPVFFQKKTRKESQKVGEQMGELEAFQKR